MHALNSFDSTLMRRFRVAAYASAAWAFIFGAINLYWGLGGTIGIQSLGERMAEQALARDPELLFFNWLSVIGKFIIGLTVLAFFRWQGRRFSQLLSVAIWCIGVLLAFYGIGNAVQHILMINGRLPMASSLGSITAAQSHLVIWDPIWTLGGILFLVTAWQFSRLKRTEP